MIRPTTPIRIATNFQYISAAPKDGVPLGHCPTRSPVANVLFDRHENGIVQNNIRRLPPGREHACAEDRFITGSQDRVIARSGNNPRILAHIHAQEPIPSAEDLNFFINDAISHPNQTRTNMIYGYNSDGSRAFLELSLLFTGNKIVFDCNTSIRLSLETYSAINSKIKQTASARLESLAEEETPRRRVEWAATDSGEIKSHALAQRNTTPDPVIRKQVTQQIRNKVTTDARKRTTRNRWALPDQTSLTISFNLETGRIEERGQQASNVLKIDLRYNPTRNFIDIPQSLQNTLKEMSQKNIDATALAVIQGILDLTREPWIVKPAVKSPGTSQLTDGKPELVIADPEVLIANQDYLKNEIVKTWQTTHGFSAVSSILMGGDFKYGRLFLDENGKITSHRLTAVDSPKAGGTAYSKGVLAGSMVSVIMHRGVIMHMVSLDHLNAQQYAGIKNLFESLEDQRREVSELYPYAMKLIQGDPEGALILDLAACIKQISITEMMRGLKKTKECSLNLTMKDGIWRALSTESSTVQLNPGQSPEAAAQFKVRFLPHNGHPPLIELEIPRDTPQQDKIIEILSVFQKTMIMYANMAKEYDKNEELFTGSTKPNIIFV